MRKRNKIWMHLFKDPHTAGVRKEHTRLLDLRYSTYRLTQFIDEGRLYDDIKEKLSKDKLEWMKSNNIDFKTLKITRLYEPVLDEHVFSVFVDIPDNIRTLYRLTFTE